MDCFIRKESYQNSAYRFSSRGVFFLGKKEESLTPIVKRLVSVTELRLFKQIILNNRMLAMCLFPLRMCAASVCLGNYFVLDRSHSNGIIIHKSQEGTVFGFAHHLPPVGPGNV